MEENELKGIFGQKVKFFRLRRQFSQAYLAEKANISITFLSNIERGNNYPKAGTVCNLADALGVEVFELFKAQEVKDEQTAFIDRISEDFTRHINIAIAEVTKQYKA